MTDQITRLAEDQPFPGMPEPEPLWAVHVEGPDDIHAATDRASADQLAAGYNAAYEQFAKRPDANAEHDAHWNAVVIPWPYSAEAHADSLVRQAAED